MKPTIKLLVTISISFIFLSVYAKENQNPQWKGTIEEEDGVKVIKNPNEPLYGEITFDLEEDLSIGNKEDENYMFYEEVNMGVDKDGNIFEKLLSPAEIHAILYNLQVAHFEVDS